MTGPDQTLCKLVRTSAQQRNGTSAGRSCRGRGLEEAGRYGKDAMGVAANSALSKHGLSMRLLKKTHRPVRSLFDQGFLHRFLFFSYHGAPSGDLQAVHWEPHGTVDKETGLWCICVETQWNRHHYHHPAVHRPLNSRFRCIKPCLMTMTTALH